MIKAYLAAFPMLYEGEDIEVRYSLFQDDIPIKKESIYLEYMKPLLMLPRTKRLWRNGRKY